MNEELIDLSHDRLDWRSFMPITSWSNNKIFEFIQMSLSKTPEMSGGILALRSHNIVRVHNLITTSLTDTRFDDVSVKDKWEEFDLYFVNNINSVLIDSRLIGYSNKNKEDRNKVRQYKVTSERNSPLVREKLGVDMIFHAQSNHIPFDVIFCDDSFGQNTEVRFSLNEKKIIYFTTLTKDAEVFLKKPSVDQAMEKELQNLGQAKIDNKDFIQLSDFLKITDSKYQTIKDFWHHGEEIQLTQHYVWSTSPKGNVLKERLIIFHDEGLKKNFLVSNAPSTMSSDNLTKLYYQILLLENDKLDYDVQTFLKGFDNPDINHWSSFKALTVLSKWVLALIRIRLGFDHYNEDNKLYSRELYLPSLSEIRDILRFLSLSLNVSLDDAVESIMKGFES